MEKTRTRGSVIVDDIKVGDIHYEYDLGACIKSEVITKPEKDENGNWVWESKSLTTDRVIDYLVNPSYSAYGPKLYDYEAYKVKSFI